MVVVVVGAAAWSASSILRMATNGDSRRDGRGAGGWTGPWRLAAAATVLCPAVAASTAAPGSDTMRPRRAMVRLAGPVRSAVGAARFVGGRARVERFMVDSGLHACRYVQWPSDNDTAARER